MKYVMIFLSIVVSMHAYSSGPREWLKNVYPDVTVIVNEVFEVEGTGFTGLAIIAGEVRGVAYYSEKYQVGMVGTLINEEGVNLTALHIEERLAFFNPQIEKERQKFKNSEEKGLISVMPSLSIIGDRNNSIFIVYDPLCKACSSYNAQLNSLSDSQKKRISWIPVSIFRTNKDSRNWAAGDIEANVPFSKMMSSSKSSLLMVAQNTRSLHKHFELLTPTVIFINDGLTQVISGMPMTELIKLIEKVN